MYEYVCVCIHALRQNELNLHAAHPTFVAQQKQKQQFKKNKNAKVPIKVG